MLLRKLLLLAVLVMAGAFWYGTWRQLPPPGVVAEEEPVQLPEETALEWPVGTEPGYTATALAKYHIHARVLSAKKYSYDRAAHLAPEDLALGWGRMSDSAVYAPLDITQRGRFYGYFWNRDGPPIPLTEIATHSANNHIIPADERVAAALASVRIDDVVCMNGDLVEVRGPQGFRWRSSLTRTDTGNGACEIFRVTDITVDPRDAR